MNTLYAKLHNDWQEHFLLYAASAIIVSTCLGGLAVFTIFQNGSGIAQMIQLFFVVAICNAVLASIVLNAVIGSLITCTLIAAINLIF